MVKWKSRGVIDDVSRVHIRYLGKEVSGVVKKVVGSRSFPVHLEGGRDK